MDMLSMVVVGGDGEGREGAVFLSLGSRTLHAHHDAPRLPVEAWQASRLGSGARGILSISGFVKICAQRPCPPPLFPSLSAPLPLSYTVLTVSCI